jgi:hypothetical protein
MPPHRSLPIKLQMLTLVHIAEGSYSLLLKSSVLQLGDFTILIEESIYRETDNFINKKAARQRLL